MQLSNEQCQWTRATASKLVRTGQGLLNGLLCAQSSSMVISIYDGVDDTGVLLVNQMTLAAATPYPVPALVNTGIYVKLISGSGDITVFYN